MATANVDTHQNELAAIDALIAARVELHEAEKQMADNELVIATAERTLKQAIMAKGIAEYRVIVKRKVSLRYAARYAG